MKKIATTALLLLAPVCTYAQPYTLPDGAPLLLNPAFTGLHNGSMRANTVTRLSKTDVSNKWNILMSTTSADYRTKSWAHGRQYAGIGLLYTYDGFIKDNYNSQLLQLSAAWHIRSRQNNRQLSLGAQGSNQRYTANIYDFRNGNIYKTDEIRHIRIYHLGAGLTYAQQISKKVRYITGMHLTSTQFASDAETKKYTTNQKLHPSHTLLAGGEIDMSSKWTIRPSLMYHFSRINKHAMGGFDVRYTPRKSAYFLGLWLPYSHSMAFSAGVSRSNWRIMSCYLLHINNQPIHTNGTSLELSLQYILKGGTRTALPLVRY